MNYDHSHQRLSTVEGVNALFVIARRNLARVNSDFWLIMLAGLLAWGSFSFGERVAVRDGLGWDGEIYWSWVKDFPHEFSDAGIDSYRIQRIMSSCTLYYAFKLTGVEPSVQNTLRGFAALNIVSIILVAYFWCLTANQLRISTQGKWLGFIGLLLNFAVLKLSGYYPILVDMQAYANGAAMSYCYVTRRRFGLWIATIVGAFLWPTQLYVGTILSLFPRAIDNLNKADADLFSRPANGTNESKTLSAPFRLDIILAALAAFYLCVWSLYVSTRITIPMFGGLFPIQPLLGLSLSISILYTYMGLRPLLNCRELYRWPQFLSRKQILWTIGSLLIVVGVKFCQASLSNRPGYYSFNVYCFAIGITAIAKPGLYFLSHIVYFGPFWLLAARFWPTVCREIHRQQGIGLTLVAAIGVCHSLDAESRHLVYLVPIVLPYVVMSVEGLEWTKSRLTFLGILSVLASKCWLLIGGPFLDNGNRFPDQYFWMNIGSFMSDETYLWQLSCCAFTVITMHQVLLQQSFRSSHLEASIRQKSVLQSSQFETRSSYVDENDQSAPAAA